MAKSITSFLKSFTSSTIASLYLNHFPLSGSFLKSNSSVKYILTLNSIPFPLFNIKINTSGPVYKFVVI